MNLKELNAKIELVSKDMRSRGWTVRTDHYIWLAIENNKTDEGYFFQDNEYYDLVDSIPLYITTSMDDYLLFLASGW